MAFYHGDIDYPYARYIDIQPDAALWPEEACNSGLGHLKQVVEVIGDSASESLTIGLFGGWGTGKTSLLKGIEYYYREKGFPALFFEAWRYSNETIPPVIPLIQQLGNIRPADQRFKTRVKKIAGDIFQIAMAAASAFSVSLGTDATGKVSADFSKVMKSIQENSADNVFQKITLAEEASEKLRKLAEEITEEGQKKLILLIDDLDRVSPEKAWQLLEGIRFFFRLPHTVVILGLDDQVIQKLIGETVKGIDQGENFLNKIVQVEIELPRILSTQFSLEEGGIFHGLDKEVLAVAEALPPLSYRTWRRIVNRYSLMQKKWKAAHPQPRSIFYLAFIGECYPEINQSMRRKPSIATAFLRRLPELLVEKGEFKRLAKGEFAPLFASVGRCYFGGEEKGIEELQKIWERL